MANMSNSSEKEIDDVPESPPRLKEAMVTIKIL